MGIHFLLLSVAFLASCVGGGEKSSKKNEADAFADVSLDAGDDASFEDAPTIQDGSSPVHDRYVDLPFCNDRNLFIIKDQQGVGFCGKNPALLYSFDITSASAVSAEPLTTLPERMGGRDVLPVRLRDIGGNKILLPMVSPDLAKDSAATFLIYDLGTREFLSPVVNASGLQIGLQFQEEPLPIAGLFDLAQIGNEFWGVLSNPNLDGTFRFGFGIVLPQTVEGLVDAGVAPNENGVIKRILSNRTGGSHFSFRTTDKKPTHIEDLSGDLVVIQNSGTPDSPASIDIASRQTHQLLSERTISLGSRGLVVLPKIALDVAAMKMYPATSQSLLEVDLAEGNFRELDLGGEIRAVMLYGGQVVVGKQSGDVELINISGVSDFEISSAYNVGEGLSDIQTDGDGNLYFALQDHISRLRP